MTCAPCQKTRAALRHAAKLAAQGQLIAATHSAAEAAGHIADKIKGRDANQAAASQSVHDDEGRAG